MKIMNMEIDNMFVKKKLRKLGIEKNSKFFLTYRHKNGTI